METFEFIGTVRLLKSGPDMETAKAEVEAELEDVVYEIIAIAEV